MMETFALILVIVSVIATWLFFAYSFGYSAGSRNRWKKEDNSQCADQEMAHAEMREAQHPLTPSDQPPMQYQRPGPDKSNDS